MFLWPYISASPACLDDKCAVCVCVCVCVCRLVVNAKPLNITYNPTALRQVHDYFSVGKSAWRSYDIESRFAC